jgi:hypothetical protein
MPIQVYSLIDHELTYSRMIGKVTEAELLACNISGWDELQLSAGLIHNIVDCTDLIELPGLRALSQQKMGNHPNMGWMIAVGIRNPLYRFFGTTIGQIFRTRNRFLNTLNEAGTFLQQVEPRFSERDIEAEISRLSSADCVIDVDETRADMIRVKDYPSVATTPTA